MQTKAGGAREVEEERSAPPSMLGEPEPALLEVDEAEAPESQAPPEQEAAEEELEPSAEEPVAAPAPSDDEDELARAIARIEREAGRKVERQRRELIVGFVEVLDDLDRAVEACRADCEEGGALMQGVEIVRERFLSKLREQGVTRLDDDHRAFDPELHDALSTVDVTDPEADGAVVGVVRAGYLIDGELLRPAAVIVGRLKKSAAGA